jgi:hypothetical protein
MKAARQVHRHHGEAHRERRRGDTGAGGLYHQKPDDGGSKVSADERTRLRGRGLRRAHHQDDRGCKWDEEERNGRAFSQQFHRGDGDRRTGRADGNRGRAPQVWRRLLQRCKRRVSHAPSCLLHSPHAKRKGGSPR